MIECRTMASPERVDAFALMEHFRDDHALLGDALSLYVERPDYGFVWLAYDDDVPAACISVAFGISTEAGGVVAELRDLFVIPERRRRGIGSALLATLHGRLAQLDVRRIEATGAADPALHGFFSARGYAVRAGVLFSRDR